MESDISGFSFSTSWNWRNSRVGSEVVEEILSLGFHKVELNYRISEEMLATIEPLVARGEVEVPSVHNVFPAIDDERFDTDSRLLGYEDEELRRRAVELTVLSAKRGADLGARALVVHPGVAPPDAAGGYGRMRRGEDWDLELRGMYERGLRRGDREYDSAFEEFSRLRSGLIGPELDRITRSLDEVCEAVLAAGLDLRIGVENRPMCWQVPDFSEMGRILERLDGAPLGLWFDDGHGAMLRHLGFFDDAVEAARLESRLIGMHIHDVDGPDDHFSPCTREGQDRYWDLIDRSPIKVIELGAKNPRAAVEAGCADLARGLERYREERTR